MAEVKWIKIVTNIFDDEKILLIEALPDSDSIIVIWFKLLCLAGKQNNGGVFVLGDRMPFTYEMFATIFRRPINTVRLALDAFEKYGMIEIINDTVTIPNWEKHQSLDAYERQKEKDKLKKREMRARQKALLSENPVNVQGQSADSPGTVQGHVFGQSRDVPITDIDKDKDISIINDDISHYLSKDTNGDNKEYIRGVQGGCDPDHGMPFGLTESEIQASLERDQKIEDAARSIGLQVTEAGIKRGRELAQKYGLEKLIEAIEKAVDVPQWRYVEGILKNDGTKKNDTGRNARSDHGKSEPSADYSFLPDDDI